MIATRLKQVGLVAAIAAFIMLTNLGGPRLWDRDEPRNAGCAREMLARGDWVVPTFNAQLRCAKPVFEYWCIMIAYLVLGVSEFSARLPSALAANATTVLVYLMGRRLFGPRAGVWAGIALASSLMFVVAGRAATPDALLVFACALAMTIYVFGTFRPRFETTPDDAPPALVNPGCYFPQHWPTVFALYAAMGLAVLTKGPVGLVLPTAVIGMLLLIVRLPADAGDDRSTFGWLRRCLAPLQPLHFLTTCWHMRPFTAIFAASLVAAPWFLAVGLATEGEFVRGFFLDDHLNRVTSSLENHRGNLLYYPAAMLFGFFPWSVFALPLAIDTVLILRRRETFHAGYLFAACWVCVWVVLFSIPQTKLPSYVTPCYPALALLVGNYVDRWTRRSAAVAGGWLFAAFGCLALAGIAMLITVPLVARQFVPGEEWLGLIGLTPLAGGAACLGLAASRNLRAAAGVFGAAAVTLVALIFALGAQRVDHHQMSHVLLADIRANSQQPTVASYSILEPSWVFYLGQPILELKGSPQMPARHQLAAFLAERPDGLVITTRSQLPDIERFVPSDLHVVSEAPLFLKRDSLVLLGRRPQGRTPTGISEHNSHHHIGLR